MPGEHKLVSVSENKEVLNKNEKNDFANLYRNNDYRHVVCMWKRNK